ncbi:ABC transporter ATP-binding protein [Haloferax namakaokahaiae]|uniref:ABC transporter ATP-binding protein n=1 Tax=Haloferax namakaokahaiae TaxID=1748331 RepID=A0ABD5ZDZ1_9EURY
MESTQADATTTESTERTAAVLDVAGLRYTYPGSTERTLYGLDFTIHEGEVFGFLGPSGAGKSTTQKVLIGLLEDYDGRAVTLGREVSEWGKDYYQHVGVSFESPNQYLKLTGRENLQLFASLYDGETVDADELLSMVGLDDAADMRVEAYSKGMRMRLNFVRALVHSPELLFLDEPTTGLDPRNARIVKNIVHDLQQQGTSVFLTTHDMTVADELCDRVAFIVDGEIPVIDTPSNLKKEHGAPLVNVEYRQNGLLETAQFTLDSIGDDEAFQRLLATSNVERIHSSEATLEDVFIDVTGRELV